MGAELCQRPCRGCSRTTKYAPASRYAPNIAKAAHQSGFHFALARPLLSSLSRTLIRSVPDSHVNLFWVELELHVHLFGVEPPSQTCTGRSPLASRRRRSECRGRDEKCVGNAPLSSRSGRIASGITWRRRRGAVLGSPHARAPKVSPKMVGSLLRGNDFGGNPQEGGNNTSLSRERNPPN